MSPQARNPWLAPKFLVLFATTPLLVLLDQITKLLARSHLRPLTVELLPADRYLTVIDGFFRLKYAENTGAAFSLGAGLSDGLRLPVFIVVTLVAIGFIAYLFRKLPPHQKLTALAIALVLGGAIGNLIDRLWLNRVVDFIDWYVSFDSPLNLGLFSLAAGEHHWPTFNVADIGISVGMALLLFDLLFLQRGRPDDGSDAAAAG